MFVNRFGDQGGTKRERCEGDTYRKGLVDIGFSTGWISLSGKGKGGFLVFGQFLERIGCKVTLEAGLGRFYSRPFWEGDQLRIEEVVITGSRAWFRKGGQGGLLVEFGLRAVLSSGRNAPEDHHELGCRTRTGTSDQLGESGSSIGGRRLHSGSTTAYVVEQIRAWTSPSGRDRGGYSRG